MGRLLGLDSVCGAGESGLIAPSSPSAVSVQREHYTNKEPPASRTLTNSAKDCGLIFSNSFCGTFL